VYCRNPECPEADLPLRSREYSSEVPHCPCCGCDLVSLEEAEAAGRHLAAGAVELTTAATFLSSAHAHLALGLLRSEELPAVIVDEHLSALFWPLTPGLGGVKVQVPVPIVHQALFLVDHDHSKNLEDQATSGDPLPYSCPACGSFELRTARFVTICKAFSLFAVLPGLALLFLPFILLALVAAFVGGHSCSSCGAEWAGRHSR
jgi:hypothetical protein